MGEIVIVCGGRDFGRDAGPETRERAAAERASLFDALDEQHAETEISAVIEGGQRGADDVARDWAGDRRRGHLRVEAEWKRLGDDAGPIRNAKMLKEHPVDRVICAPGRGGTANMRAKALAAGVRVTDLVWAGSRLERRHVDPDPQLL